VVTSVLLAVLAAGAMTPDGGSGDAPTQVPPVAAARATGRFVDGAFSSDAGSRRWRLWVPSGYDAGRRQPLVVMLHGCTQDPDDLARGTRVTEHADRDGLLVLLPEQPEAANPKKCWNWYDPAHQRRDAGEPSLIAGMTRQVMSEWAVDARRTYVAGISAGAAMASLLAVAYPELYAAVGLHSGIPYRAATTVMEGVGAMMNGATDTRRLARLARDEMGPRARPIPAIIVQGAGDPVVRPVNAIHTRDLWLEMNRLARGADPASPPEARPAPREESRTAGGLALVRECHGARAGAGECEVEVLTITGLGHAWSGGSTLGTFADERGPDATAEILRFLAAHPMPDASVPNARRP
jgi:poly(hydroxyalkanoate) depolymerase family esterase